MCILINILCGHSLINSEYEHQAQSWQDNQYLFTLNTCSHCHKLSSSSIPWLDNGTAVLRYAAGNFLPFYFFPNVGWASCDISVGKEKLEGTICTCDASLNKSTGCKWCMSTLSTPCERDNLFSAITMTLFHNLNKICMIHPTSHEPLRMCTNIFYRRLWVNFGDLVKTLFFHLMLVEIQRLSSCKLSCITYPVQVHRACVLRWSSREEG